MEANNAIYFVNAGQHQVFTTPKSSDWQCHLFGSERGIVYTPLKGSEPNCFHRKMQELCFGVKWKKVK